MAYNEKQRRRMALLLGESQPEEEEQDLRTESVTRTDFSQETNPSRAAADAFFRGADVGKTIVEEQPVVAKVQEPEQSVTKQAKPQKFSDTELAKIENLLGGKDQSFLARLGRTAQKIPGDIKETVGEEFSAIGEVISDPGQAISGIGMALEGTADIAGRGLFGENYPVRDPRRAEMVRQMASQFGEEIKNVEERPVRSLVNLASLATLPLTGGGAALARTAPRASKLLSTLGKAADVIDPVTGVARGAGKLYKGAKGKLARGTEKVTGLTGDTAEALQKLSEADQLKRRFKASTDTRPGAAGEVIYPGKKSGIMYALGQVFDAALGFTTGTSQKAMGQLRQAVRQGQGDVVRSFRKDKTTGPLRVVNKYIDDHKAIRKSANDDFEKARQAMEADGLYDQALGENNQQILTSIRNMVSQAVSSAGATIKVGKIDPKLKYNKAKIEFPVGEATIGKKSRKRINKILNEIINLDPNYRKVDDFTNVRFDAFGNAINAPEQVTALMDVRYLDTLKKQLRDEIDSIEFDDTSRAAKKYLNDVHKGIAEMLSVATDGRHADQMKDYSNKMMVLDAADEFFGIDPRKAVEVAGLKTEGTAYGRLAQALMNEPTKLLALEQFQKMAAASGGSNDLVAALTGSAFSNLFGAGLVVKSEIAQILRAVAAVGTAYGTGAYGALTDISLLSVFSPQAVGAITPKLVEAGMKLEDANRFARELTKELRAIGKKIPLKQMAAEGASLAQVLERLNEDAELAQMIEDLEKGQN